MARLVGLILAAGHAYRLLPHTRDVPKCLLELAPHHTILDALVDSISDVIDECHVIGGHGFATLQREVERLCKERDLKGQAIYNPEYKTKNNCHSLYFGLTALEKDLHDADICVINSDVVVDPRIITRMVQQNDRVTSSLLVIDQRDTLTEEDMKVQFSPEGRVVKIAKDIPVTRADGEFIGISIIKSTDVPLFRTVLGETARQLPNSWYEHGYQALIDRGYQFAHVTTNNWYWTEIDTFEDLENARIAHHARIQAKDDKQEKNQS